MSDMPSRQSEVGLGLLDSELRLVALDEKFAELIGVAAGEQLGRPLAEVAPAVWAQLEPLLEQALAGETLAGCPFPAATAEGSVWSASLHPLVASGALVGVGIGVRNDAAALEVEEGLRVRTDLYAMLARTNRAASRSVSADELYREMSEIAVQTGGFRFAWVGVPRDRRVVPVAFAGVGADYLDDLVITLDEADPRSHGPTGRAARTGERVVVNDLLAASMTEPWHERADAAGFAASAAFPIKERSRVVAVLTVYAASVGFFTDELVSTLSELTPSLSFALDAFAAARDRRRDEADLRLRDRAIQAISQGIVIVDALAEDMPIVYASPSVEHVTGYSRTELLGRSPRIFRGPGTDPAVAATLDEALRRREPSAVELLNYRKNGTPFWNAVTVSPVTGADGIVTHFVATQTDITEKRELEESLRRRQRLEALGELAGGIAHDFNNLLTVIIGSATLAVETTDPETRKALGDILDAGERATQLVRQLLAFSRQQAALPVPVDLNEVISAGKRILERLIEPSIEFRYELADAPVVVTIDRGQIDQVLINLVVNARDAMPGGGTITIRTGIDGDRSPPAGTLTVADTGAGIDPEIREKIFLPFFTTKEPGAGTGLGLAAVYGIVTGAGGAVALDSTPDTGTSFVVALPLAGAATEPAQTQSGPQRRLAHFRALLVEDEPSVRAVAEELLMGAGCELVLVAGSERAAELAGDGEPFDLLVTDVVMPGVGGVELARTIRALRPELPVLFVSGYPLDQLGEATSFPNSVYLSKPFTQATLRDAVSKLLPRHSRP